MGYKQKLLSNKPPTHATLTNPPKLKPFNQFVRYQLNGVFNFKLCNSSVQHQVCIILGKSLKLGAHYSANAAKILVTFIKPPLLLFLSALTLVHFCYSCKCFGNFKSCKILN